MDPAIWAAIITGAICLAGNWAISTINRAKTEGAFKQALTDIVARQDRGDLDQANQWSKIHEHTADIGFLKGKVLNGKANGHSSGL